MNPFNRLLFVLVGMVLVARLCSPAGTQAQGLQDFTAYPEAVVFPKEKDKNKARGGGQTGTANDPRLMNPFSSAPSALAVSSSGEGIQYRSWFYPQVQEGKATVRWIGLLQGLFVDPDGNLREDTNGDGRLVLEQDFIVKARTDAATGAIVMERYADANGDRMPDTLLPAESSGIRDAKALWEAGARLAWRDPDDRRLLTWTDENNDELVAPGEVVEFSSFNLPILKPYLQAKVAPVTAANVLNFVRGEQVPGLRDREVTLAADGTTDKRVWKLGDIVHSTPTVVGAPKERYDVLYGDASYTAFFTRYRNRRQVVYAGANDGMLHAFNAGFYHRGDDPATEKMREHGWVTRTQDDNAGGAALGEELWGFIPYQLLPHLQWSAAKEYTHVFYVDLKPKITDARIFKPDQDHPNGWGTVLIGGFRFGGSCGSCLPNGGAPAWTIRDDFNHDGDVTDPEDVRSLFTAYFALDITNPEKEPVLLWSFSDIDMGLSTSYPAIVRVAPPGSRKADDAGARWFMVVGSGPTGYDRDSNQSGMLFAVDLKTGPTEPDVESALVTVFPTDEANAAMGDPVGVDADLDYRVDALYVGSVIHPWHKKDAEWSGKLYRLSTGRGSPDPNAWGIGTDTYRMPTVLLEGVAWGPSLGSAEPEQMPTEEEAGLSAIDAPAPRAEAPTPERIGPIMGAPTVTLDERNHVWVFVGTGRYADPAEDRIDERTQHLFGVKDAVIEGRCLEISATSCESRNLLNVSTVQVCLACRKSGAGLGLLEPASMLGSDAHSFETMVQNGDGWYVTLPSLGEGAMTAPTLTGGILFVPTVAPAQEKYPRDRSTLYALYYATGTAYKEPVIGTERANAGTIVRRSVSIGEGGTPSHVAVRLGPQGSGGIGSEDGPGCAGRATSLVHFSTGTVSQLCTKPALPIMSRYLSWMMVKE